MDKTVALYMRLSDEDDNLAAHEESNSISHQRKLMLDHIQKLPELKDCNIIESYLPLQDPSFSQNQVC